MAAAVKKKIRISGACLFILYLAGLIYFLLFAESYGRSGVDVLQHYNIEPFREIRRYVVYWKILGIHTVILNLAGNIMCFLPFGALVPVVFRNARRWWKVVFLAFEVSVLIEVFQLSFQVGCFDVDDIILNTVGAGAGYLVYCIAVIWIKQIQKRQNRLKKNAR